jgi:broad specificity phosphatase PhoE
MGVDLFLSLIAFIFLHCNLLPKPLTELGKQQAMALGKWLALSNPLVHSTQQQEQKEEETSSSSSSLLVMNRNDYFWRIYSSDLGRTKFTTQLLLQQYYTNIHSNHQYNTLPTTQITTDINEKDDILVYQNVLYDPRLREIARGVRQGLSKQYTYEDAIKIYNDGLHLIYNNDNNSCTQQTTTLPLYESDDDGWDRLYTLWLMELVHDIQKDVITQTQPITTTNTTVQQQKEPKCYNILVVTHGALLRVFFNQILGNDRIQQECNQNGMNHHNNDDLKTFSQEQDPTTTSSSSSISTPSSRLHVPNTSLTIIDIPFTVNTSSVSTITPNITYPNSNDTIIVQRFLSTEHYHFIEHVQ